MTAFIGRFSGKLIVINPHSHINPPQCADSPEASPSTFPGTNLSRVLS